MNYLKQLFNKKNYKKSKGLLHENDECTICFENINSNNKLVIKCNHIFHLGCLAKWYSYDNNNCPMCRNKFCRKTKKVLREENLRLKKLEILKAKQLEIKRQKMELQNREREREMERLQYIENERLACEGEPTGVCSECGKFVYRSWKKSPSGNRIYHKVCFLNLFKKNRYITRQYH